MEFTKKHLKSLLDQIGEHSGNICGLLNPFEPVTEEKIEQARFENDNIQEILVSVYDWFLS